MRPLAGRISLDREGLLLLRHETAIDNLDDDRLVDTVCLRETDR